MHLAAATGGLSAIRALHAAGARLNSVDAFSGATPLHVAAIWGRRRHVKKLLEFGGDWSLRNNRGRTPCHVAIRAGQRDLAQVIVLEQIDCTHTT